MAIVISIILTIVAVLVGFGVKICCPSRDYEVIEEAAEEVIREETGVEVEFRPEEHNKEHKE